MTEDECELPQLSDADPVRRVLRLALRGSMVVAGWAWVSHNVASKARKNDTIAVLEGTVSSLSGVMRVRDASMRDNTSSTGVSRNATANPAPVLSVRTPISNVDIEAANNVRNSFIDWDPEPFAEGFLRHVRKGFAAGGKRYVCKYFKLGGLLGNQRYEGVYYNSEIKVGNKAQEIVQLWTTHKQLSREDFHLGHSFTVHMNVIVFKPKLGRFIASDDDASASGVVRLMGGQMYALWPWLENWEKFNSNTGWTSLQPLQQGEDIMHENNPTSDYHKIMQALSHFSYHVSNGEHLLCDLQGSVYFDGIILNDPAILSTTRGTYGVKDLGKIGISSFFSHHQCNEHCESHWRKPRDQTAYLNASKSTYILPPPLCASGDPRSSRILDGSVVV